MPYRAEILLDSLSEAGPRLTTWEVEFPRIILPEFNTHRVFSRNFSSSRAIPFTKTVEKVMTDPFIPAYWGKNQPGMSAAEELVEKERIDCEADWLRARDRAVKDAERMSWDYNLHKQIVNRLLEPWMWATGIVSATEWDNFYALRTALDAQPEFRKLAVMMKEEYVRSTPQVLGLLEFHIPMLRTEDYEDEKLKGLEDKVKVSVGRLCRVSYLTHDGVRDPAKDIELCSRLIKDQHMSPLEHVAACMDDTKMQANFRGFMQYRMLIEERIRKADGSGVTDAEPVNV